MKKTITKLALFLGLGAFLNSNAQTLTFDNLTLAADTFYEDHSGADWQSGVATFRYNWNTSWTYWSEGSAYTNVKDSVDGTYTNLYGAITANAFSGNNYVTVKDQAIVTFSNTSIAVQGFYVTNTTYAWKSIKNGDSFARKFGDTTGTGSGTTIPQGHYPDWFKLSVVAYQDGIKKTDSVHFYLADYRAAGTANDYAIKNWQYVDCSTLGEVDSIKFVLQSSDTGAWGMNTPGFFAIDNLALTSTASVEELESISNFNLYPNPTNGNVNISYESHTNNELAITLFDINGREISKSIQRNTVGSNQLKLFTENLENGVYFIELSNGNSNKKIKFIKL